MIEELPKQSVCAEIAALMLQVEGPFPYDDCSHVLDQADVDYGMLVPDLDTFFSTIAGYCSSANRIERWAPDRRQSAREGTIHSFFEQYPQYRRLQWFINDRDTPSLHAQLVGYERMRVLLRELLEPTPDGCS